MNSEQHSSNYGQLKYRITLDRIAAIVADYEALSCPSGMDALDAVLWITEELEQSGYTFDDPSRTGE